MEKSSLNQIRSRRLRPRSRRRLRQKGEKPYYMNLRVLLRPSDAGSLVVFAIIVEGDRLKPRAAIPTDLEKLYLQGSMYAYAGTYTVD
jgi:hypothetical protein